MTVEPLLQHARRLLDQGQPWAGLGGDALAWVLSGLSGDDRWLVVVDDVDAAEKLFAALRFFHGDPESVVHLAADDTRPYDGFSADPARPVARLLALERVDRGKPCVVVAPARALLQRIPDRHARRRMVRVVGESDTIDRSDLVSWFSSSGYLAADYVREEGFFAVRGDVVDIWPAGRDTPLRIDFFDDEIEAIRRLDPATGRTTGRFGRVRLMAVREEILDEPALERASVELARLSAGQGRDNRFRRRILEELRAGVRFAGLNAWLPALVPVEDPLTTLADFRHILVHPDDVFATLRDAERQAHDRYRTVEVDDRPLVTPADRYVSAEAAIEALRPAHVVHDVPRSRGSDLGARTPDGFAVRGSDLAPAVHRLARLADDGARVAIVSATARRSDNLREMLEPHGVFPVPAASPWEIRPGLVNQLVGDLARGFVAAEVGLAYLPDTALFSSGKSRRGVTDRVHAFFDAAVTHVTQIKEGDYVVHKRHGVGVYRGLARMRLGDVEQDLAKVEYRGGDLMYLPVSRLAMLSRYVPSSEDAEIKVDKLGGQTWDARKAKIRDSLLGMADELLRIHARRELASRPGYPVPGDLYHALVARFPFDETPDQAAAIDAVLSDLDGETPMDRLLVGDVGYGKTEVAVRAAARVVEAGRQAAVLCPTTVLAYQHLQTFQKRFEGLPVRVGLMCRFNSEAEDAAVREGLRSGEIDVVIGTTAILARTVKFRNLGLMVIDEEHRFGVKQKERLKKLRSEVDVLAMSATPIPRTLQMGLSGLREMSMMTTPPKDRLAVRTSVGELKETRIRDAILLELERGGQAFIVHNRIETLRPLAEKIHRWVPEARIDVAHGQMSADELEDVLVRFTRRDFDVLVCTAIMEAGIDLPNVNTMVVDRADQFGVAQLYQLRGRVGRGNVRAQCLLLLPDDASADARRRVQVLVENQGLGAGFQVAAADLEMRGAGNLLGEAQSGNIDAVGYETWLELLEEAVHQARGDLAASRVDTEVEVPATALIPDAMVPDTAERLAWYRRISSCRSEDEVEAQLSDLESERGELPPEVRNLGDLVSAQIVGRELGVLSVRWLQVRVVVEVHPNGKVPRTRLDALAARMPRRFKVLDDGTKFEARFTPEEAESPLRFVRWLLARLRRDA